jgi:hypothetical protein
MDMNLEAARAAIEKEECNVQTIDPAPVTALVAMCVGALMVHAGVAKRRLAWRRRRTPRDRRRRR